MRNLPYSLISDLEKVSTKSNPPVHLWHPDIEKSIDLVVKENGVWEYEGSPINRPRLVRLFASVLRREGDSYFLVTPAEKCLIKVEDVPFENYLFYGVVILFSLFNPMFFIQAQSIIEIHKIALFSFIMVFSLTAGFFYYQYNNQLIPNVISQTLKNDLKCSMEKSKLKVNENKSPLISLYFEDNIYLNFEPECNIQLTFTSLTDSPINDINSVNKTVLDLTQKSFININFKKL